MFTRGDALMAMRWVIRRCCACTSPGSMHSRFKLVVRLLVSPLISQAHERCILVAEHGFALLTGGDDGAVAMASCTLDGQLAPGWRSDTAHASAVTCAAWLSHGDGFVTSGSDQRLVTWSQDGEAGYVRASECVLDVADVGTLAAVVANSEARVVVGGCGVQVLRVAPSS